MCTTSFFLFLFEKTNYSVHLLSSPLNSVCLWLLSMIHNMMEGSEVAEDSQIQEVTQCIRMLVGGFHNQSLFFRSLHFAFLFTSQQQDHAIRSLYFIGSFFRW